MGSFAKLTGTEARSPWILLGSWPMTTRWWTAAAFVIAAILTAITLAISGHGYPGIVLALKATARWSFLLFWCAYAGGALATLWPSRFTEMAHRGRDFGLAFAAAMLVHVGLVLWYLHVADGPQPRMLVFWAGILSLCLLTLFSLPRLRAALGVYLWRTFRTIAVEYIALVFAVDFIFIPLQMEGITDYPLTSLPFALMLVGGTGLRLAALAAAYRGRKPFPVKSWPAKRPPARSSAARTSAARSSAAKPG